MKSWVNSKVVKWLIILPVMFALFAGSAVTVQAAVVNRDGIVNANEVIDDDLFMSAQKINMNGTINGNLMAVGGTIVINGVVNGDVFLAGQDLTITDQAKISGNLFVGGQFLNVQGKIAGSVFGGGTTLNLRQGADVAGNLYFGGYQFLTESETNIHRDVYAGSYQSILNGAAGRNIYISAAAIELNGSVAKNATLDVSSPGNAAPATWQPMLPQGSTAAINPGLRISKDAKINGQLTYTSQVDQSSGITSQPQGGVVYQTPVPGRQGTSRSTRSLTLPNVVFNAGSVFLDMLRDFFTLLVLGGLVLWLKPAWLAKTQKLAMLKPAPSAGYGLGVIIVGYLAAGLAALLILIIGILFSIITLGGLSNVVFGVGFSGLALVMAVFTLAITYGSKLVVTCLIGSLILNKLAPKLTHVEIWGLVLGVFLFAIVQPIPIFGFLISVLVTIIGMGAIWMFFTSRKMAALAEGETPAA